MRLFAMIWLTFGFVQPLQASAESQNKSEAMAVVNRWFSAMSHAQLEEILKLFAPDAIFFGTSSQNIVSDPAGIRAYFEKGFKGAKETHLSIALKEYSAVQISDTVVAVAGIDNVSLVKKDGKISTSVGRISFVLSKRNGKWQIIHFHRSQMP